MNTGAPSSVNPASSAAERFLHAAREGQTTIVSRFLRAYYYFAYFRISPHYTASQAPLSSSTLPGVELVADAFESEAQLFEHRLPALDTCTHSEGSTALYRACWHGSTSVVRLLLSGPPRVLREFHEARYGPVGAPRGDERDEETRDANAANALLRARRGKGKGDGDDEEMDDVEEEEVGSVAGMAAAAAGGAGAAAAAGGRVCVAPSRAYAESVMQRAHVRVNQAREGGFTPLYAAVRQGHVEIVRMLLEAGANPWQCGRHGYSPLHMAAYSDRVECVRELVRFGKQLVDLPNVVNATALLCAAQQGHTEVCRVLIEAGADVNHQNASGWTALIVASRKESTADIARLLLENGADVNIVDNREAPALYNAAFSGIPETVKLLVEAGADINHQARQGFTPLYAAANKGHFEVCQYLLAHGADPDACTATGSTPLYIAAQYGRESTVRLLLDSGATVDAVRDGGFSPLYAAADKGYHSICSILIQAGAQVNRRTSQTGDSALTIASYHGHFKCVELLLAHDANTFMRNQRGNSPLMLADQHPKIAAIIRRTMNAHRLAQLCLGVRLCEPRRLKPSLRRSARIRSRKNPDQSSDFTGSSLAGPSFGRHPLFDVNVLGIVYGLLDGEDRVMRYPGSARRLREKRKRDQLQDARRSLLADLDNESSPPRKRVRTAPPSPSPSPSPAANGKDDDGDVEMGQADGPEQQSGTKRGSTRRAPSTRTRKKKKKKKSKRG